jgi:hypothetical protein
VIDPGLESMVGKPIGEHLCRIGGKLLGDNQVGLKTVDHLGQAGGNGSDTEQVHSHQPQ